MSKEAKEDLKLQAVGDLAGYLGRFAFVRPALEKAAADDPFPSVRRRASRALSEQSPGGVRKMEDNFSETHRELGKNFAKFFWPPVSRELSVGDGTRVSVFTRGTGDALERFLFKMYHGTLDAEAVTFGYLRRDLEALRAVQGKDPSAVFVMVVPAPGRGLEEAVRAPVSQLVEGNPSPPRQVLFLLRRGEEEETYWEPIVFYGPSEPLLALTPPKGRRPAAESKKPKKIDRARVMPSLRKAMKELRPIQIAAGGQISFSAVMGRAHELYLASLPAGHFRSARSNFIRAVTQYPEVKQFLEGEIGIPMRERAQINLQRALAAFQEAMVRLHPEIAAGRVSLKRAAWTAHAIYLNMTPREGIKLSLGAMVRLVGRKRGSEKILALLERAGVVRKKRPNLST